MEIGGIFMGDEIEKIVDDAVSNVSCEVSEKTSKETLIKMKEHLLGLSGSSDESFIYQLVKNIMSKGDGHVKRK